MSDTQWPRYEVFQQARANQPLRNVGSVHAPDDELALLIARDVFVRRPDCHDLWVVHSDDILSRTAQELETTPPSSEHGSTESSAPSRFHVFQKRSQAGVETFVEYVGEVEADSSMHALAVAIKNWHDKTAYVWWIFPESAVTRNDQEDANVLFDPAREKPFRHQTHYRVHTLMREVKRKREKPH